MVGGVRVVLYSLWIILWSDFISLFDFLSEKLVKWVLLYGIGTQESVLDIMSKLTKVVIYVWHELWPFCQEFYYTLKISFWYSVSFQHFFLIINQLFSSWKSITNCPWQHKYLQHAEVCWFWSWYICGMFLNWFCIWSCQSIVTLYRQIKLNKHIFNHSKFILNILYSIIPNPKYILFGTWTIKSWF